MFKKRFVNIVYSVFFLLVFAFVFVSLYGEPKKKDSLSHSNSAVSNSSNDAKAIEIYKLEQKYSIPPSEFAIIEIDSSKEKELLRLVNLVNSLDEWMGEGFYYPPEEEYKALRAFIKSQSSQLIMEIYFFKFNRAIVKIGEVEEKTDETEVGRCTEYFLVKIDKKWKIILIQNLDYSTIH